jgi:hypothetical protein
MEKAMSYTAEYIAIIANKLQQLPEVSVSRKISKQEAVKILKDEIQLLQKRGYTLESIADSLRGNGLDITTPTLKSYLQRAKTPTKTTKKKNHARAHDNTKPPNDPVNKEVNTNNTRFKVREDTIDI